MKAIQINYYNEGAKPILHNDVVQIESKLPAYRSFLCKSCGRKWMEQINAFASVIEDEEVLNNIEEYYPNYELCSERHVSKCKHYNPSTYACCATCNIGRYCHGVVDCEKYERK